MTGKVILTAAAFCLTTFVLSAESYVGLSGSLVLPQGGGDMRRLGGATVRFGGYLTDDWALEGAAAWMENRAGLAVGALWHWHGCEEFNRLFGYERLDPFFTFGVKGWLDHGEAGPSAGLGALYYLSDDWALRCDAEATLGLEREVEMVYSLSAGLQYSF